MVAIECVALTKEYRKGDTALRVIDNLSFPFPEASSLSIVGRSGVGKSTLLHLLAGLDEPTSGTVLLHGQDQFALTEEERAGLRNTLLGFVYQFHNLLPEFSAEENVGMPLFIAGVPSAEVRERVHSLLSEVGLYERRHHLPGELSGGEAQRAAIARALIGRPKVIFADEPTGNLDVTTARVVQELLLRLAGEQNSILIAVTHSKELAQDTQVVLEMGPGGTLSEIEKARL
ncbi:MAG: ABC transporter ATP-binding protein [Bdellovibrionales bacterium]|nr:ABC transporter ATP-binding protein [Bdellovibrionales bacterium]